MPANNSTTAIDIFGGRIPQNAFTQDMPIMQSNGARVVNAYRNILQRTPDTEGLDYWVSKLDGGEILPENFNRSFATAAATFNKNGYNGTLSGDVLDTSIANARRYLSSLDVPMAPVPQNTNTVINDAYQNVLNRPADQQGVEYWANQINNGTSTPTNIQNDIRNAALDSGELRTTTPAPNTSQTPTVVPSQAQQGVSLRNIDLANERLNRVLTQAPIYEGIFNPNPASSAKGARGLSPHVAQNGSSLKGGSNQGVATSTSSSAKGA